MMGSRVMLVMRERRAHVGIVAKKTGGRRQEETMSGGPVRNRDTVGIGKGEAGRKLKALLKRVGTVKILVFR